VGHSPKYPVGIPFCLNQKEVSEEFQPEDAHLRLTADSESRQLANPG